MDYWSRRIENSITAKIEKDISKLYSFLYDIVIEHKVQSQVSA